MNLPIAEVFTSIHGEGWWAGTPMTFIRLAGCTVGKVFIPDPVNGPLNSDFPILPTGRRASVCTTFDGRQFPCDTDYSKTADLSIDKILSMIPNYIKHICITGGEPLMHGEKLELLVSALMREGLKIHFETSGTIDPPRWMKSIPEIWWACSPKHHYLPFFVKMIADEIRVMVDHELNVTEVQKLLDGVDPSIHVYFCPLSSQSDVLAFDPNSMKVCEIYVAQFPGSRISIQMHKVLGVR